MALLQRPCKSIIRRNLYPYEYKPFTETLENNGFKLFKFEIYDSLDSPVRLLKYVYRNQSISVEFQLYFSVEGEIAFGDRTL